MYDGRNPGWTRSRYRVWSGGSVCIIVGGVGYEAPISNVMMPLEEQNVPGSRDTANHFRVTADQPQAEGVVTGYRCLGP